MFQQMLSSVPSQIGSHLAISSISVEFAGHKQSYGGVEQAFAGSRTARKGLCVVFQGMTQAGVAGLDAAGLRECAGHCAVAIWRRSGQKSQRTFCHCCMHTYAGCMIGSPKVCPSILPLPPAFVYMYSCSSFLTCLSRHSKCMSVYIYINTHSLGPFILSGTGNEDKVRECMNRAKNSMQSILQLSELPNLAADPNELEELDIMRHSPLQDEEQLHRAVQVDGNVETRQALPRWLSRRIERSISKWTDEHSARMDKIDERMHIGKNLTPAMQSKFERWNQDRGSCQFLFSKKRQCQITSIRSDANVRKMENELLSVQVAFSTDPSELLLKASNGEAKRLVLLRGTPCQDGAVPSFLDQKPSQAELQTIWTEENEQEEPEAEGDAEIDGHADQEEAMLEEDRADNLEVTGEFMADSSEEEIVRETVPSGFTRVKSFFHREAYKKLASQGLTEIPPLTGCLLAYHTTTRCWQGYFPGCHTGLTMTWGGRSKRTESEAIIGVILKILECHVAQSPKDKLWQKQLEKVRLAQATVCNL